MAFGTLDRDRLKGAAAAIVVQIAIGYALIVGLAASFSHAPDEALVVFRVAPPPPPPRERVIPPPVRSKRTEGAASPPNLRASPSDLVAPPPVVPIPPPPLLAAPKAGPGTAPAAGAADVRGPGYGSGGIDDGSGGGGSGDGDGGGVDETPPRWRKGRLRDSDFPDIGDGADLSGKVAVRFLVGIDGRVGECRVTGSSGSALLDATTCRLIRQRYRYDPSRDARSRPVPAWIIETHEWLTERESGVAAPPR